jgi:hypothetical protein
MANENLAILSASQLSGLDEDDYRSFCAALRASARGRAFLGEYARRNRHTDTEVVLEALARLERTARNQAMPSEADRIRQDLRALLNTLHAARPQLDSSPGAIKAATLTSLIDFVQARVEALLMPNRQPLSQVPPPEQPELPIPRPSSMNPPQIALVQGNQTSAHYAGAPPEKSRSSGGFDLTMLDLSRLLMAPHQAETDRQPSMFDRQAAPPPYSQATTAARPLSTISYLDLALAKPEPLDTVAPAVVAKDARPLATDWTSNGFVTGQPAAEPYELWLDQDHQQTTPADRLANAQADAQIAALAAALMQAETQVAPPAQARVGVETQTAAKPYAQFDVRVDPPTEARIDAKISQISDMELDLGLPRAAEPPLDTNAYLKGITPGALGLGLPPDAPVERPAVTTAVPETVAPAVSEGYGPIAAYAGSIVTPFANLLVNFQNSTTVESPAESTAETALDTQTNSLDELSVSTALVLEVDLYLDNGASEAAAEMNTASQAETVSELQTDAAIEPQTEAVAELPADTVTEFETVAFEAGEVAALQADPIAELDAAQSTEFQADAVAEMPAAEVGESQADTVIAPQAALWSEEATELHIETPVTVDLAAPTEAQVEPTVILPTEAVADQPIGVVAAAEAELQDNLQAGFQAGFQDDFQGDFQDDFQAEAEFSLGGELGQEPGQETHVEQAAILADDSAATELETKELEAKDLAATDLATEPLTNQAMDEPQPIEAKSEIKVEPDATIEAETADEEDPLAPIMVLSEDERIALFT